MILAPRDRRVVVQYLNVGIFSRKGCDQFVLQQVTDVGNAVLYFPCVPAGKDAAIVQGPITFFIEPGFALLGHSIPALPSDGQLNVTLTGYTITP